MTRTVKVKKRVPEARSHYPQGYNPDGNWAGFFVDEETAKKWAAKKKGRRYDYVPLPKIERTKPAAKKSSSGSFEDVLRAVKSASGRKPTKKRTTKRSVAQSEPQNIEWSASDIDDEAKMSEVAKKSQDEAIKKLKGKK